MRISCLTLRRIIAFNIQLVLLFICYTIGYKMEVVVKMCNKFHYKNSTGWKKEKINYSSLLTFKNSNTVCDIIQSSTTQTKLITHTTVWLVFYKQYAVEWLTKRNWEKLLRLVRPQLSNPNTIKSYDFIPI